MPARSSYGHRVRPHPGSSPGRRRASEGGFGGRPRHRSASAGARGWSAGRRRAPPPRGPAPGRGGGGGGGAGGGGGVVRFDPNLAAAVRRLRSLSARRRGRSARLRGAGRAAGGPCTRSSPRSR
ncbi:hypothetical protein DIPPA_26286 [Diplonema papillatum]|nr:hypothetical protein DIPPA_26286 [Diplonema papillatum]